MEYQENMSRFFIERALDHHRQALVHIEAAIDLCPDTDLLPKLSHYRKDTMRRIPKERKERGWVPAFLRRREAA